MLKIEDIINQIDETNPDNFVNYVTIEKNYLESIIGKYTNTNLTSHAELRY